jgi:hypothetical protein
MVTRFTKRISNNLHLLIIILIIILSALATDAQQFSVRVNLDTSQILPGARVKMNIGIQYEGNYEIRFPSIKDSLPKQIEMLAFVKGDSLVKDGNTSRSFVASLTSFDSGTYVIPPMPFVFVSKGKADTLYSVPCYLSVQGIAVDAQKDIFDVKPPLGAPLTIREILFWVLLIIFCSMIITITILLVRRYRRNQPAVKFLKPQEPPDIIALRELDELKEQKLWQQGKTKEYYTVLSGIVRAYIENRFEVPALEQTSQEILYSLKFTGHEDESTLQVLTNLLEMADLVKFAKALPLPDDNEGNLLNAYVFINRTKIQSLRSSQQAENGQSNL